MEFREAGEADRETVLEMMEDYYYSEAAQGKIPRSYMEHTFDSAAAGSPYVKVYVMEEDGEPAGYSVAEPQYSSGRGGRILMVEEFYLKEGKRGKGLSREFLEWVREEFQDAAVLLKLRGDNGKTGCGCPERGFGQILYEEISNVKKKA